MTATRIAILEALRHGPKGERALIAAMPAVCGAPTCLAVLRDMRSQGLVAHSGKQWRLTLAGKRLLRPLATGVTTSVYVPPRVVRRAGSDHSYLPSRAAGRLIYRSDAR